MSLSLPSPCLSCSRSHPCRRTSPAAQSPPPLAGDAPAHPTLAAPPTDSAVLSLKSRRRPQTLTAPLQFGVDAASTHAAPAPPPPALTSYAAHLPPSAPAPRRPGPAKSGSPHSGGHPSGRRPVAVTVPTATMRQPWWSEEGCFIRGVQALRHAVRRFWCYAVVCSSEEVRGIFPSVVSPCQQPPPPVDIYKRGEEPQCKAAESHQ